MKLAATPAAIRKPVAAPAKLARPAPKFAQPAKRSNLVAAPAPVAVASASKGLVKAAAAPILSSCSPCSLIDTVDFCVRFTVPNGFDVVPGASPCAALQSDALTCDSQACEQSLEGITIENPCDPLTPITCTGVVTLYKLHVGGDVDVVVNLPVASTKPGDLISCPDATSIQISRQICVPVDNVICVGCSPVACGGLSLLSGVVLSAPQLLLPGDSLGCEAVWQVQGTISLNTSVCDPALFTITTCFECVHTEDPLFAADLELWNFNNTIMVQSIPGVLQNVNSTFAPVAPGQYYIRVTDGLGNEYTLAIPVTLMSADMQFPSVGCIPINCAPAVFTNFNCNGGQLGPLLFFEVWDSTDTVLLQTSLGAAPGEVVTFLGLIPGTSYNLHIRDTVPNQYIAPYFFTVNTVPPFAQVLPIGDGGFDVDCPIEVRGDVTCAGSGLPPFGFTVHLFNALNVEVSSSPVDPATGAYFVYPPSNGTYTIQVKNLLNTTIFTSGPIVISSNETDVINFVVPCPAL
jgi:hypothetical protein